MRPVNKASKLRVRAARIILWTNGYVTAYTTKAKVALHPYDEGNHAGWIVPKVNATPMEVNGEQGYWFPRPRKVTK